MKKLLLYLSMSAVSLSLSAQNSIRNWEKTSIVAGTNPVPTTGYSWFTTAGNINSCAYNPITDKLYVADRGNNIYIINPGTGAQEGTLSKTGIVQGSFGFQKIRVTSTGEIFAASLRTSTTNGNTFVYYWANEAANPVQLGNATTGIQLISQRSVDAFALTGSGDNVVMYFAGSISSPSTGLNLEVVNKTGSAITDFAKVNTITLSAGGNARSGIAPVTTGITSDIWISGVTIAKRLITSTGTETKILPGTRLVAPGTYTATPAGSISDKFGSLEYFEIGTRKFLATTGANDNPFSGEGLALHIYDITNVNAIRLIESTKLSNTYIANTNATSDIAIKRINNANGTSTLNFFQLINNNGLASYTLTLDGRTAVISSFNAIENAKQGDLTWTTSKENEMKEFQIERSSDGVNNFTTIGTVATTAIGGNSTTNINYSFTDLTPLDGNNFYRLKMVDLYNVVNYSDVKTIEVVLPVSLTSFNAAVKNSTNTLTWATASESNNSGFEIESSLNGTDFNKIGFLASKGVSGNSTTTLSYIYEDAKAAKGVTYYRLKQIDLNGAFEYSDVKAIDNKLSKTADFTIYPNPVVNYINVATSIENLNGYQYELYNSNGVKVKTQNLLNDKVLDVNELAPSVYILKIVKDNNLVQSFRIVKQ